MGKLRDYISFLIQIPEESPHCSAIKPGVSVGGSKQCQ